MKFTHNCEILPIIKRWFLFNFAKVLRAPFCGDRAKKLLPDISFDSGFRKIVLASLRLS